MMMLNSQRLELARKRRRFTAKSLAEVARVSPVTISRIVNGTQEADRKTVEALAAALGFPVEFFFLDEPSSISPDAASFRSLTSMSARERDAALAAGAIAYELADWVASRFDLPEPDLLDLGADHEPEAAARTLRQHWLIGERPIGGMISLLEAKGVRVFSLAENTKNVDAFSSWRDDEPFVFLNTFKTTERSRFDAAHELGHLVLHRHAGPQQTRRAEYEAQSFAASFLMPRNDVVATIPYVKSLDEIIHHKKRWGVSASALAYRLHKMGILSDWQYRSYCIQLNRDYGRSEPEGLPSERSSVWHTVLTELWKDGVSREAIARDLRVPEDEIDNLIFGLVGDGGPRTVTSERSLRLVKG